MKQSLFRSLVVITLFFLNLATAFTQDNYIHYTANTRGYSPAPNAGTSEAFTATLDYNERTRSLYDFSFEVQLLSFYNTLGTSNLIEQLGNSERFTNMTFKSTTIQQKKKGWIIEGQLFFKGIYLPVVINAQLLKKGDQVQLTGDFRMNSKDYTSQFGTMGFPSYFDIDFLATFNETTLLQEASEDKTN